MATTIDETQKTLERLKRGIEKREAEKEKWRKIAKKAKENRAELLNKLDEAHVALRHQMLRSHRHLPEGCDGCRAAEKLIAADFS